MSLRTHLRPPALAAIAALALLFLPAPQASAQGNAVMELYNKGVQLMVEEKWADAGATFEGIIKDYGVGTPFDIYGPAFGLIHYHLGLCHLQLKKYKEAGKQFEESYRKYPNAIPDNKPDTPQTRNHYHLVSLYQWGRSEQGAEEYEGAVKLYNKFISEQPDPSTYSAAELYTNLGVCHAKLGKVPEATGYLQQVYDNYARLNPREEYFLHRAFYDLCDQWVEKQMTSAALDFMDKNDGLLRFSAYDSFRYGFTNRFLKLAQESSGGEAALDALALRFFTLTPRTADAISELEDRKVFALSDEQKASIQTEIDRLRATLTGGTAVDISGMRLLAYIYEKNGSFRAAYAVYDDISRRFPAAIDSEKKPLLPDFLYNATRTAFSFGDLISAQHHGMIFLKKFPGHPLEPEVQSMLMDQLFRRGDYLRCIEIAEEIKDKLPPNSPQHDLCLFCLGGSYYYDGQYEAADPVLNEHHEMYKESAYLEEASYYHGANKVKLLEWDKAAPLLDAWLEKYPESGLRSFALLDRANCHFAVGEGAETKAKIDEIEQKYPDAIIYDRALHLRGNVLQDEAEYAAAAEAYLAAKAKAEELGNLQVSADALAELVAVSNALEDWEKAAAYYDEFQATFPENYMEPLVVARGLDALKQEEIGRGQEGLDRMEEIIDRLGRQENADLEKAISKYASVSVELNGAEQTIAKFKEMGRKPFQPEALKAWLLVLRIDVIQEEMEGVTAEAEINTAFTELQSFDKKVLAPYVLARIGNYLLAGGKVAQAVPWYQEILSRPGIDSHDHAKSALAVIFFQEPGDANKQTALEYTDWVIANSGDSTLQGKAAFERAAYFSRKEDWPKAEEFWYAYVDNKSWREGSPEAWFSLGTARDKQGKVKEALNAYLQNYTVHMTHFDYSVPAMARAAEIQKSQGNGKAAYDLARTGGARFKTVLSDSDLADLRPYYNKLRTIYEEFVNEYYEEGQVRPFE